MPFPIDCSENHKGKIAYPDGPGKGKAVGGNCKENFSICMREGEFVNMKSI
jgi:hypothetical protein